MTLPHDAAARALAGRRPARPCRGLPARHPRAPAQAVSPEANLRFDGAAGAALPRPALPTRGLPPPVRGGDGRAAREAGLPSHRRRARPGARARLRGRAGHRPTSRTSGGASPPIPQRCPRSPSRSRLWPTTTRSWPRPPGRVRHERDRPHRRGPPCASARRPAPARDQNRLAALRLSADKGERANATGPRKPTNGPPRASSPPWPSTRSPQPRPPAHRAPPRRGAAAAGQDARRLRARRRAVR